MMRPIIYSLTICSLGAVLEGLFAGNYIKQHFVNLRMPSYPIPFWAGSQSERSII
jgi:hypothetical protein